MKFLGKFIFYIFSNAFAILITNQFVKNFFGGDLVLLLKVSILFTLINTFIKPLLKIISAPLIFITFGLFTLVLNAVSIYLLDFFSEYITIQNIKELTIATIIISIFNFILERSVKKAFKD
jgi:putative membrane protein